MFNLTCILTIFLFGIHLQSYTYTDYITEYFNLGIPNFKVEKSKTKVWYSNWKSCNLKTNCSQPGAITLP